MSESLYPPFLKWGKYTSKDQNKPDIIEVKPLDLETFETEYGINIRAEVNGTEMNIPIHNFTSRNKQLFEKLTTAIKKGKIAVDKKFKIRTWLGISKNNFPIRRFELVF